MPKGLTPKRTQGLTPATGILNLLYQQVHVVAAPVAPLRWRETLCGSIHLEAFIIGKRSPCNRVRVEIIIHVDRIYIVPGNNIPHNLADETPVFGQPRIKKS